MFIYDADTGIDQVTHSKLPATSLVPATVILAASLLSTLVLGRAGIPTRPEL